MTLILPKHIQQSLTRDRSISDSIRKSAKYRMDSDDFVTRKNVALQLAILADYIKDMREDDEAYNLPQPVGWKIQVLMLTIPEETDGGLVIVEDAREARSLSSPQGVVLAVGSSAYNDPSRFTVDGELQPWCKVGDRITFVKYDASMFQLANGQRLGTLNDTQPISKIDSGWETPT